MAILYFLDGQFTGCENNFQAKQEQEAQKKMKLHLSKVRYFKTSPPKKKKTVYNMKLSSLFKKKNLFSSRIYIGH